MQNTVVARKGSALSVLLLAALVAGVTCLTIADWAEAQVSNRAKQSLQKRKARISARYDIIGPNETLVGIRLPPPWDTLVAKPSTEQFYAIQDEAWKLLLGALFPNGIQTSPRKN